MVNFNKTAYGHELVWADTNMYSSKVVIIKENEKTPYIYHKKQDITLFILQGIVQLIIEGRNKTLNEGDIYHIPPKLMHRIIAFKGDATILETGTKLEDDIVVVEK